MYTFTVCTSNTSNTSQNSEQFTSPIVSLWRNSNTQSTSKATSHRKWNQPKQHFLGHSYWFLSGLKIQTFGWLVILPTSMICGFWQSLQIVDGWHSLRTQYQPQFLNLSKEGYYIAIESSRPLKVALLSIDSHNCSGTLLGDDGGSGPGLRLARALLIFFREDLLKWSRCWS